MLRIHYLPGEHWVTDAEAAAVQTVAEETVEEARRSLPLLHQDLYVVVHQTPAVLPSGDGGFTLGPQVIRWDVDPALGIADVAKKALRPTLLHEAHHAARLTLRPSDSALTTWENAAVFEGLATVFATEQTGFKPPWTEYDPSSIAAWTTELFAQAIGEDASDWRFRHPDGRENIVYKVGSWIVERATQASGRTAAELVGATEHEVMALAGLAPNE